MRLYNIMLFCIINIYALKADTCYSIQIWSQKATIKDTKKRVPESCGIYDVGEYIVSRCGCFVAISEAKSALAKYKKEYPTAYITKISRDNSLKEYLEFNSKNNPNYTTELKKNFTQLNSEDSTIYGLEIEGKYEEYANQKYKKSDDQEYAIRNYVDYQHYIKLNFSLFKDGFFEYKNINRKERKKSRLFYLKNLSTIMKNDFSDMKILLNRLNNQIDYRYYIELTKLYQKSMIEYKKRYDNHMIERYKYTLLNQRYKRYKRYSMIYKRDKKLNMTKDIYLLMKDIDHVLLDDLNNIINYALNYNTNSRIVSAKNSIFDESKSYLDTIEVDIYAKRNSIDEIGTYDTLGIEATFPLDMSSRERQRVAKLKQQSNNIVKKSTQKSIKERVSHLYYTFKDMQSFIDIDKDDIFYFKSRIVEFEKLKKDIIDGIYVDPYREILNSSHKIIDLKFNILRTKIKLIAILYEIAYISNIKDISKLIKNRVSNDI
jgi:hypothetical protein